MTPQDRSTVCIAIVAVLLAAACSWLAIAAAGWAEQAWRWFHVA